MRITTPTPVPRQIEPRLHHSWTALLTEQHAVLSREQCRMFQLTPDAITAQLKAGRWQRVLPAVYATYTGPLTRSAWLAAAVLYGGPNALLSHRTAAEEWKLLPISADEPIHVTVPYGCSAVSQPPRVVVHRSRAIRYLAVETNPPRTTLADTIVDIATSQPTPQAGLESIIDLVGKAPVRVSTVNESLEKRPPWRYRKSLADGLLLAATGIASVLELRYLTEVEHGHGLPCGHRQSPVTVDDRTLWEDVTYDHIGVDLTVRLDGRQYHATPGAAFRDRRRDNAAELQGRSRLVYGWHDVADDPCGVAAEVVQVLQRAGWPGEPTPCRRCPRPYPLVSA